jgi:hypothetical protein
MHVHPGDIAEVDICKVLRNLHRIPGPEGNAALRDNMEG